MCASSSAISALTTEAELAVLEPDLGARPGFTNLLLTQQKLCSRDAVGCQGHQAPRHRGDPLRAGDPLRRAHPGTGGALTRGRNGLHPGELQREIARLCDGLERLALSKAPAPQRAVNRAFNASIIRRF